MTVTIYDKPVRVLMKDMADAFALQPSQSFTKRQAIDWFAQHYPKIKTGTISAHLIRLSTNAQTRTHYNPKQTEDDVFYQIDGSHFRLYDFANDPAPIRSGVGKKPVSHRPTKAHHPMTAHRLVPLSSHTRPI